MEHSSTTALKNISYSILSVYLSSIVYDDEAGAGALVMFVRLHRRQFLQTNKLTKLVVKNFFPQKKLARMRLQNKE